MQTHNITAIFPKSRLVIDRTTELVYYSKKVFLTLHGFHVGVGYRVEPLFTDNNLQTLTGQSPPQILRRVLGVVEGGNKLVHVLYKSKTTHQLQDKNWIKILRIVDTVIRICKLDFYVVKLWCFPLQIKLNYI